MVAVVVVVVVVAVVASVAGTRRFDVHVDKAPTMH